MILDPKPPCLQGNHGKGAWELCLKLKDAGLLAKPTQRNVIRFAPPLVITEFDIMECAAIIEKAVKSL